MCTLWHRAHFSRHLLLRTLPVVIRWSAPLDKISSPTDAKRRKDTHCRDRALGMKFVPFVLETYFALSDGSDRFLVECATLASGECARSGPFVSLLCTWFRQRVSIASQMSLAHAIRARTLRLEQSMAFLPPTPLRVLLRS